MFKIRVEYRIDRHTRKEQECDCSTCEIDERYTYRKHYDSDYTFSEAMEALIYSGIDFVTAEASDEGDCGMKYFGGKYPFDEFLKMYDRIGSDIDGLGLVGPEEKWSVGMFRFANGRIFFETDDPSLDINDLLAQAKRGTE